jgi:hypothetical protein
MNNTTLNDIKININVNPLVFHHNFEKYKDFNIGKKALAPKSLLYTLSGYDIQFPIYFKINNTIFTIYEFYEDIDCLYIPTELFYSNQLEENSLIEIDILKDIPPKGEYLKLKPKNKEFYKIQDIKCFLEHNFKKFYATLYKFEEIKLPYYDSFIEFTITDCEPSNIISLNELEELKIDFEPMDEDISGVISTSSNNSDDSDDKKELVKFNMNKLSFNYIKNNQDEFTTFSGKGRRLCD